MYVVKLTLSVVILQAEVWLPFKSRVVRTSRTTGASDYVCEYCGERFHNASNLKRHRLIHLGIFPFKCALCGKKYHQKENTRRHVMAVHGIFLEASSHVVKN